MLLVGLSIAVLLAAPLVAIVLGRRPALAVLLDSFVLVTVGGIVALHVLPQSIALAGPISLAAAAVGLFVPILLHRVDASVLDNGQNRGRAHSLRDFVLLVVLLAAVFVHGLFDGGALADHGHGHGQGHGELAAGVILHRLPAGLALWVVARPKLGTSRTLVVVAALIVGTVLGSVVGDAAAHSASAPVLALFQAFVAGSLLHIIAETPPFATDSSHRGRIAGVCGAVLAVCALWAIQTSHDEGHAASSAHDAGVFAALAFDAAFAVALSFLIVGLLTALLPPGGPRLQGRGVRVVDAFGGAMAGLPLPLCSCAVAPLYTDLVDKGASPAGSRAFLVAAPELGVPAVLLSARLLGWPFMTARIVGAALLALLAGMTARATATRRPARVAVSPLPFIVRLGRGLRHGVKDAVDHVGPWILLGLGAAALLAPALEAAVVTAVSPPLWTVGLALLALPLYLCAAGVTPVAAVLLHAGVSAGAVLAFLLVGPCTSIPTLSLLARRHGKRAAAGFAAIVVVGAIAVGVVVDMVVGPALLSALPPLSLDQGPSLLEQASAVFVAALLLASLYRQGVRGFLLQIMSPQHEHAGDHEHGPGCGHDHGPPIVSGAGVRGLGVRQGPIARVRLDFDPRGEVRRG